MKKSALISMLALAFAAASIVMAEAPADTHNPADRVQHRVNFMTKLLALTPAQQQQATTIFTNAATSLQGLHGGMRTSHQNLKQAIQSNDTAAIDQNAAAIGNAMAQGIAVRAKAQAAFYQILTPDQQSKLSQFASEHPGHRGHRFFKEEQ